MLQHPMKQITVHCIHQNKHHFKVPEHCVKSWRKAAEIQVMWVWSLKENNGGKLHLLAWASLVWPSAVNMQARLNPLCGLNQQLTGFLVLFPVLHLTLSEKQTAFTASVGWSQIRCNLPSPVTSYLWQYHSPWHREHRFEAMLPQKPHFGFSGSKLSITSRL